MRATCPAILVLLDLIVLIIFVEEGVNWEVYMMKDMLLRYIFWKMASSR
jgi:hypothetical protein